MVANFVRRNIRAIYGPSLTMKPRVGRFNCKNNIIFLVVSRGEPGRLSLAGGKGRAILKEPTESSSGFLRPGSGV